jgi:type II secretory pathway pseudopilin PulG
VELLIVIAIIGILAGMLLPALIRGHGIAKKNQARTEMRNLEMAINAYDAAYSRYPANATGAADLTFGYSSAVAGVAANSEVMVILMDLNIGANLGHAMNPQQLTTFSANSVGDTVSPGFSTVDHQLRDPWGHPYVITLDLDGNKRCRDAFYSTKVSQIAPGQSQGYNGLTDNGNGYFELDAPVMIWSAGPDGKYDDSPGAKANAGANKDNILSWQ